MDPVLVAGVVIAFMGAVSSARRFARQWVGNHVSRFLGDHAYERRLPYAAGCGASCLAGAGVSRNGGRGER